MRAQVTRQPGQRGRKKLTEQYGERLVYVRSAPLRKTALVGVRVGLQEVELQRRLRQAGGKWNPARRLWEMKRGQALKLGLQNRIEVAEGSISNNPKVTTNRTW
jgi:hypothetical protein